MTYGIIEKEGFILSGSQLITSKIRPLQEFKLERIEEMAF